MDSLLGLLLAILAAAGAMAEEAANPLPVKGRTIAIDPGHNGRNAEHPSEINQLVDAGGFRKACNTSGTNSNDGSLSESELNFDVGKRLRKRLERSGATVVMTRSDEDGVGPCVNERAQIGNEAGADLVVSIHADGNEADETGFHVIYPGKLRGYTEPIVKPSKRLATDLRNALDANEIGRSTYIGEGSGLDRRVDLGGLNLSEIPAAMIEMGNMRNAGDLALMKERAWRNDTAEQIEEGILAFLAPANPADFVQELSPIAQRRWA